MSEKGSANDSSTNLNVKWILIAVVALTVLFLFKKEIGGLIDRTESVAITAEGVTLKTQTITTALGSTILAGPPTVETAGITEEAEPNFAIQDGFKINWKPELWSNNEELAQLNDAELFLLFSISDGYQPTIAVKSYEGFTNAKAFVEKVSYPNRKITAVTFGPSGETGIRTSIGITNGVEVNYIERILFNAKTGLTFVASADRPIADVASKQVWESTRKVINSFRLN